MPPFQYSDAANPFALSIGEMLAHSADPQARALGEAAAARAQAARDAGQAWGTFARQAGQLPAQLIDSARQREKSDLDFAAAKDERDQRQGMKALGGLMAKYVTVDTDGHQVYDVNGFMTEARQNAQVAPFASDAADRMAKGNDLVTQFRQGQFATKQAAVQGLYAKVAASGGHPVDLEIMAKPLIDARVITVDDIRPMAERLTKVTDPRVAVTLLNAAAGVKSTYQPVGDKLIELTPGLDPRVALDVPKPPTAESAKVDAYIGWLKKPAGTAWEGLSPEERAGFPSWEQQQTVRPPNSQESQFLLDGNSVKGDYIPGASGQPGRYFYQGQDVTGRARVIPPASTQGQSAPEGDYDLTGDEFLKTIPAAWRTTVRKIASYEEDPTKVASMRGGMREKLMTWVNQVNPGYKADEFANRAPTRKAYTTGTQGQQINAINTAIGHIDQITGLVEQLNSGSFVPGNALVNKIKTALGAAAVTNFDTLKDALAGEVASVLSKGGATVSGIAEARAHVNSANSPQQLAGYVKTLIPVMGSKLAALDYQYHQAMGADDAFSALSPETKSILSKHGFDPSGKHAEAPPPAPKGSGVIYARDPQGGLHQAQPGTALPSGWTLEKR